jgi:hypothetical protein
LSNVIQGISPTRDPQLLPTPQPELIDLKEGDISIPPKVEAGLVSTFWAAVPPLMQNILMIKHFYSIRIRLVCSKVVTIG